MKGKRSSRPVHRINRIGLRNQRNGKMNGKTGGSYPSCSNNTGRTGKMLIIMVRAMKVHVVILRS